MKYITVSDVVKRPSIVTNAKEVTLIEDAKRHIAKSVVIPYAIYQKLQEKLEEELYLLENSGALNAQAYDEFSQIETVVEELSE